MMTATVPPNREFTAAWVAYALFIAGVFMWWPALIGAIVCLVKRGAADAGFIDSHYGWLLRTFGWSTLGYLAFLLVILGAAWPLVADVIASRQGDWSDVGTSIQFSWDSLLLAAGTAVTGVIGLLIVWFWFVYRVLRGAFRLGAAQPVP